MWRVPLVYDERGALREGLPAVRAHVRLLARVHALVQLQVTLLCEPLAARPNNILLFTSRWLLCKFRPKAIFSSKVF